MSLSTPILIRLHLNCWTISPQGWKKGPYNAFYNANRLFHDVHARLDYMDEFGIQACILAPTPWIESAPRWRRIRRRSPTPYGSVTTRRRRSPRGVKVLIIDPVNPDAVAPALSAAADVHIPVMTVDRNIHGDVATYVRRYNVSMGRLVGAKLAKHLAAGGKIIEIQGDAGGSVMAARRDGFAEGVKDTT